MKSYLDYYYADPLENYLNRNLRDPLNKYVESKRPIIEAFRSGGNDGGYVIGTALTGGMHQESRARAAQAIQNAYDRGDTLTLVGFGFRASGTLATGGLVALPAAPAMTAAPIYAVVTAGATATPLMGAASYYHGKAAYHAFSNGDIGEGAIQAFHSVEFGGGIAVGVAKPALTLGRIKPRSRVATGFFGIELPTVDDFYILSQIDVHPDALLFYSVPNSGGGRTWESVDEIDQMDFRFLVW